MLSTQKGFDINQVKDGQRNEIFDVPCLNTVDSFVVSWDFLPVQTLNSMSWKLKIETLKYTWLTCISKKYENKQYRKNKSIRNN
jgi:hypothetical protein